MSDLPDSFKSVRQEIREREKARSERYHQAVKDVATDDSRLSADELQRIIEDYGRKQLDFDRDVLHFLKRFEAVAALEECAEYEEQAPLLNEKATAARAALIETRARHKLELQAAERLARIAENDARRLTAVVDRKRREAEAVLQKSCAPGLITQFRAIAKRLTAKSLELAAVRPSAVETMSESNPERERLRVHWRESALKRLALLKPELEALIRERDELAAQIYDADHVLC